MSGGPALAPRDAAGLASMFETSSARRAPVVGGLDASPADASAAGDGAQGRGPTWPVQVHGAMEATEGFALAEWHLELESNSNARSLESTTQFK